MSIPVLAGRSVQATKSLPPLHPLSPAPPRPQIIVERSGVDPFAWEGRRDVSPFEPVPLSPPSARPEADPPAASPEPRRRVGKIMIGAVGAVLLVAGGVFAGAQLVENDSTQASEPIAATIDEPAGTTLETQVPAVPSLPVEPGPVSEDAAEPVAAVAAAVAPAVVRIDTGAGTGSGIIYDESGLLVTNAHVVGDSSEVTVQLADGTRTTGTVVGTDPSVDVAVIQIDASLDFAVSVFAPTSTVEVGQLAVAVGSPFGLDQTVTAGIISAVNRAVPSTNVADGSETVVEMVQTDAPINPGNSGGALADRQGRVVGMNTSIRTDGTVQGNLGVGFAIPSDTVALVAGRIVNGDSLETGFLGVSGQDPVTGAGGALITELVAGGPAEAAGLRTGDLIVAVNGQSVPGMTELAARIRLNSPGTIVAVEVIRDGSAVELDVTLGSLEQ